MRLFYALLIMLYPSISGANTLDQAEALILQGQTVQALALLDDFTPSSTAEQERELWARAVAFGRENRPREALTRLQQLVALKPQSARYRLELADTLLRVGQVDRARYHYTLLRGSTTDPTISGALDSRIMALDQNKSWEAHLSFALTPETNPARRTAAETVTIAGLPFVVDPQAREQPATGTRLRFGGAVLPWVGQDTRARIGLSFDGRFFEANKAPDDMSVTGETGVLFFGDRARQFGATLHGTRRWIDAEPYSFTTGATLHYSQLLGQAGAVQSSLRVQEVDYDQPGATSIVETRLHLRYSHNISTALQLHAGGFLEFQDSDLEEQTGLTRGLSIGGQYRFDNGVQLGLEFEHSRLGRDGVSLLFDTRREDSRSSATLRLNNSNWNAYGFSPVLELGLERQRSSIPIYSYDNTRISLDLTRRF